MGPEKENPKQAFGSHKTPASTFPATVKAEVSVAMLEGAIKYGKHNFRASPILASTYYDAANRHLDQWFEGEDRDQAPGALGLHHVTKAIASLVVLRDAMIAGTFVDDRPHRAVSGEFFGELDLVVKNMLEGAHIMAEPFIEANRHSMPDDTEAFRALTASK